METNLTEPDAAAAARPARPRNIPYARIWTHQAAPLSLSDIEVALTDRGFVPGFSDPDNTTSPLSEAGLAEANLETGAPGYRVISLSSSRGGGCRIFVTAADSQTPPDEYLAKRAVPKPRLVYHLEAAGPSNSDRNLTEGLAETLMILTNGAVEIGGLGTKGNRSVVHTSRWLGAVRG